MNETQYTQSAMIAACVWTKQLQEYGLSVWASFALYGQTTRIDQRGFILPDNFTLTLHSGENTISTLRVQSGFCSVGLMLFVACS